MRGDAYVDLYITTTTPDYSGGDVAPELISQFSSSAGDLSPDLVARGDVAPKLISRFSSSTGYLTYELISRWVIHNSI